MTMPDPLGPVVITVREIYDQLVRLTTGVEGLVRDHSTMVGKLNDHESRTATKLADYELRIRTLERARWPLPSIAVLVAIASALIALVALLTR